MPKIDFSSIEDNLKKLQAAMISFPANASFDAIAASLALYLSLSETGKNVSLVSSVQATVNLANLVGIDKIKQEISGQDLVISFDYVQDSIEKVSYNIENNKFNLVVQNKSGYPPLDPGGVSYSQTGGQAGFIFVIGANNLAELGDIYQKNQKLFDEGVTVNIDNRLNNARFGKINFVDQETASISEIILGLVKINNLPFSEDMANNLFLGIRQGTDNFNKQTVSWKTFEAAAFCLRQGAKREKPEGKAGQPPEERKPQIPPDWLSPKIFQSSRKI